MAINTESVYSGWDNNRRGGDSAQDKNFPPPPPRMVAPAKNSTPLRLAPTAPVLSPRGWGGGLRSAAFRSQTLDGASWPITAP